LESVSRGSRTHGVHAVQEVDRHVSQCRQHLRRVPLADPAMVLVERHIPSVVQLILDRPMLPYPGHQVEGRHLRRSVAFMEDVQATRSCRRFARSRCRLQSVLVLSLDKVVRWGLSKSPTPVPPHLQPGQPPTMRDIYCSIRVSARSKVEAVQSIRGVDESNTRWVQLRNGWRARGRNNVCAQPRSSGVSGKRFSSLPLCSPLMNFRALTIRSDSVLLSS